MAILRTIKARILQARTVSALELSVAGPTAEMPEVWCNKDYEEYWDDVNGGFLDPQLTRAARQLEMDWVLKEKVYSYIERIEKMDKY